MNNSRTRMLRLAAAGAVSALAFGAVPGVIQLASATPAKSKPIPTLTQKVTLTGSKSGYALVNLTKPLEVPDGDKASAGVKVSGKGTFGGIALIPNAVQWRTTALSAVPVAMIIPSLPGRPEGAYPYRFVGTEPDGQYGFAERVLPPATYRMYLFTKGAVSVTATFPGLGGSALKVKKFTPADARVHQFSASMAGGEPTGSFGATDELKSTGFVYQAFWQARPSNPVGLDSHYMSSCLAKQDRADVAFAVPFCNNITNSHGVTDQSLLAAGQATFSDYIATGLEAGKWTNQIYWYDVHPVTATGASMIWLSNP